MNLDLVTAELRKLTSTRTMRWMAAATLALVGLNVALTVLGAGRGHTPALGTTAGTEAVFAAAGNGMTLLLVVGIMIVTGEFRHGTATTTFLVTPRRRSVIAAKTAAAALAGAAFAVLASVVTVAVAVPWLAVEDASIPSIPGVLKVLASSAALTVLAAMLGVGIGALVRNQTLAVGIALGWVLIVEQLVAGLIPSVGRWLVNGAAASLVTSSGTTFDEADLLPPGLAMVILIGYTSVSVLAGLARINRRDV